MATYIGQNVYIRPNYIVTLPEFTDCNRFTSQRFLDNKVNLEQNEHKGKLSDKAIKKMKNAINWLLAAAQEKDVYSKKSKSWFKFKINFVTLTLPDTQEKISDYDFKTKLLNPYLTYMRKYFGLKNYVWKLEFQKNGKLHLHITTDSFCHHSDIRRVWNNQLLQNGYLVDFNNKFGHQNPNSTDVHSVYKIDNVAAYLAKYMSKNSEDLVNIKGRIWGCSYELSRANKTQVFIDRDACHLEIKPLMSSKIDYVPINKIDKYTGEVRAIGEVFFINAGNWLNDIGGKIKQTFETALHQIRNLVTDQQIKHSLKLYEV